MGEPLLSIITILGLIISILGLIISAITLSTARTIYNRIKDKRITQSYFEEINKKIELIDRNRQFLPSDFSKQVQNILKNAVEYVRKRKLKKLKERVKYAHKLSIDDLYILLKEISIEIADEGL